jgi:hypothetical protein
MFPSPMSNSSLELKHGKKCVKSTSHVLHVSRQVEATARY